MGKVFRSSARKSMEAKFQQQFFKTSLCVKFQADQCNRGQYCRFAHSPDEVRSRPCLDKTKLCPTLNTCVRTGCLFAHSREELVATNKFAKTKVCHFGTKCISGDACRYAHSINEITKPKRKNIKKVQNLQEKRKEEQVAKCISNTQISWAECITRLASSPSVNASFDMRTNSRGSSLYGSPRPIKLNLFEEEEEKEEELAADSSHEQYSPQSYLPAVSSFMEMFAQQNEIRASNNMVTFDGGRSYWMEPMMMHNMHEQPQSPIQYPNIEERESLHIGSPVMINSQMFGLGNPFMMNRPSSGPSAAAGIAVSSPASRSPSMMQKSVLMCPLGTPMNLQRESVTFMLRSEQAPRPVSSYTAEELDAARPLVYED